MVEVSVVKQKLQDYIVNQIDVLGESNPAIKLVKPLAKRAIINNIDSFDKFINAIAKDGKIDIEGIIVLDIRLTTTTTGMNKEATVNVIDMMKVEVMMEVMAMMKKNVCFLCKCLE